MSHLNLIPLGKVASIISGYAFKSEQFTDSGVPVIKIANIKNGAIVFGQGDKEFLPDDFVHATNKKFHVARGDVLISLTGSHVTQPSSVVGRVAQYKENFLSLLNQRAGKLVLRADAGADLTFLYYILSTSTARMEIAMLAHGAANQANVSPKDVEKLKFNLPKKSEQTKIAAILLAYDDLIENNQRRIALLEKMAEEIYREWFVRLRFPGHEKVKFIKGVPEGWKLVKLENAFKFTGGGTPTKEVNRYWDGGDVNWFTPSDITGANGIFLERSGGQCTEEGFNNSSAKMFPAYSVMLTSRATIGAVGINLTPASTNQGFITCIPNAQYPLPYLYHWIKLAKPHFELLSWMNMGTILNMTSKPRSIRCNWCLSAPCG